jgi:hypothetical protein
MKAFLVLCLLMMTFMAEAQRRPRPRPYPVPRPMPQMSCEVLRIDNWHRVFQAYRGRVDRYTGRCSSMYRCLQDLRHPYNRYQRCVDRSGRW